MVTLRAKQNPNGKFHLYVDTYEDGRRKKKYLGIYVAEDYTRPKRDENGKVIYDKSGKPEPHKILNQDKENWKTANAVRDEIQTQINKKTYGFDTTDYSKKNFTEFFQQMNADYKKKDFRKGDACLNLFKLFNDGQDILCRDIDEDYVIEFRDYIVSNTKGDTPSSYFRFFKKAVKKAHKNGFLKIDYADDVTAKKGDSDISKDVVSIQELRKMDKIHIHQKEVKDAFTFSYFTGLDCATIRTMTGRNIIEVDNKLEIPFKETT